MTEKLFSISKAAAYLNISRASIDRWQSRGVLRPVYTPGGHRRFLESDLRAAMQLDQVGASRKARRAIIYARVSSSEQAGGPRLQYQKERLINQTIKQGYQVAAVLAEVSGDLNGQCPQLQRALGEIAEGHAEVLLIESRDRLACVGLEQLDLFVRAAGGWIEALEAPEGPGKEALLDELIATMAFLGVRLYGRRTRQVVQQVSEILRSALREDEPAGDGRVESVILI